MSPSVAVRLHTVEESRPLRKHACRAGCGFGTGTHRRVAGLRQLLCAVSQPKATVPPVACPQVEATGQPNAGTEQPARSGATAPELSVFAGRRPLCAPEHGLQRVVAGSPRSYPAGGDDPAIRVRGHCYTKTMQVALRRADGGGKARRCRNRAADHRPLGAFHSALRTIACRRTTNQANGATLSEGG